MRSSAPNNQDKILLLGWAVRGLAVGGAHDLRMIANIYDVDEGVDLKSLCIEG
jgi:hypothetical protein